MQVVAALGAILIENATITLTDENDNVLFELVTDETGHASEVQLEAPDASLMDDPYTTERRYSVYNVRVDAVGFRPVFYTGIMIFGQSDAVLVITMHPLVEGEKPELEVVDIEGHALDDIIPPELEPEDNFRIRPRILPEVIIPNEIIVHLGEWNNWNAPNVSVPFIDYIKNVTSHEIHHNWPEETVMANIYCYVSFALNRVFTEFYLQEGLRVGRNLRYHITSTTHRDQRYNHNGATSPRLNAIVDRFFNYYLARVGHLEPFLAQVNDGIRINLPGRLSQWGSYFDGRNGMNAWQIIQKYYGSRNLELRWTDNFSGPLESWPGAPLSLGSSGEHVRAIQRWLNRILGRHITSPNIIINPVNGVFGSSTQNAVRTHQGLRSLPQTGIVDRATWFSIARFYAIEKSLWEMHSEGVRIGIDTTPPTTTIREGNTGRLVLELQFLLNFIQMYYEQIPFVAQTSRFDGFTLAAVREFQRLFGLNADGVVGRLTWAELYAVYWGIVNNTERPEPVPPEESPPGMIPFPGNLQYGSRGDSVRLVQRMINSLAEAIPGLWKIPESGIFGEQTRAVTLAFQRIFALPQTGIVGPITWDELMRQYLDLQPGGTANPQPESPPFPGTPIQQGARGDNVRLIQQAINRLVPCNPGRLWILNDDGIFGPMTRDAIFTFQNIFGMQITGIVEQNTWNRLMNEAASCASGGGSQPSIPPYPGHAISQGATGNDVRLIQQAINTLAPLYPGRLWILNTDGVFGPMTRDAVFAVQSIFGMPINGIVGPNTWDRLMREAASNAG